MSFCKYVQEPIGNTVKYLDSNYPGWKLTKRATAPWLTDYISELDMTPELNPDKASYYQSQIGILHWIVELGRVDIITEMLTLASHMALPWEGHLNAVFHVHVYLKNKHNSCLVLDPSYPDIDMQDFQEHDWKSFYEDIKELIPVDAPEPCRKDVDLRLYVDSDHAGDKSTRRLQTGFFV